MLSTSGSRTVGPYRYTYGNQGHWGKPQPPPDFLHGQVAWVLPRMVQNSLWGYSSQSPKWSVGARTSLPSLLVCFPHSSGLGSGAGGGVGRECEYIILALCFLSPPTPFSFPLPPSPGKKNGWVVFDFVMHLLPCGNRSWSSAVTGGPDFFSSPQDNCISCLLQAGAAVC